MYDLEKWCTPSPVLIAICKIGNKYTNQNDEFSPWTYRQKIQLHLDNEKWGPLKPTTHKTSLTLLYSASIYRAAYLTLHKDMEWSFVTILDFNNPLKGDLNYCMWWWHYITKDDYQIITSPINLLIYSNE